MSERTRFYLPSLDGLRALSISLVVLGHAFALSAPAALRPLAGIFDGALGVRIFFVISGFLITTLLLREQERGSLSLRRFYIRRTLRLAPVQLAYILVLAVLTQATALQVSACQFATALTYTKNYACAEWVDGHLWSLSVEEQFYLVWPALIAFLPRRWMLVALAALAVASPLSRVIQYQHGARAFFWLTSNTDVLMAGCLAAIAWQSRPAQVRAVMAWRPALSRALACIALAVPVALNDGLWLAWLNVPLGASLQAAAAAYLILSLVVQPSGWSYRLLNLAPVRFLGLMSYSLYVWQQVFFAEPAAFGWTDPGPIRFALSIGGALAAGLASYLLIEKPMGRLRDRFRVARAPQAADKALANA